MTADPQNEKPRKERLRRLDRIFADSPICFVTMCTADRRSILANPLVHQRFRDFANAGNAHGAYVGAYVIMPDHIHLFVALEQERRLSDWMKSLKNAVSKALRDVGTRSPHWQKGFFDHVLRSSDPIRKNGSTCGTIQRERDW